MAAVKRFQLYHYERKWGTTTGGVVFFTVDELYHYERKWGTTTQINTVVAEILLYHYERKWGTTTNVMQYCGIGRLYHYERKWGTMVFAPMPKNDFLHIISPFSVCVNPPNGRGRGCRLPGGFGIYLTKGETLGKLELHKT